MPILSVSVVPGLACAFALIALAASDAVKGRTRITQLSVELPAVMRVAKDRAAEIAIRVRNESARSQRLRLGLPLPPEIESDRENLVAVLPEGSPHSRLIWPCTARRRGSYLLQRAYLECSSPLGFWAVRSVIPIRSEIRVFPDLRTERKDL